MIKTCMDNVREKAPLVHNITNYVTVNDVANVLWHAEEVPSCQMNRTTWRISHPSA